MKRNKKGSILILTGLLLITAALFLSAHNMREGTDAGKTAKETAEILEETIISAARERAGSAGEKSRPDYEENPEMEMPVININGNDYIGILKIPSLDLELPVMGGWSYPLLRISPCRYTGSVYTRNLVVMAHNYTSHFGRLKNLHIGDEVMFIDADGNVFSYKTAELEVLMPEDVAEMQSGGWDLTLFTCTLGGQSRVTVHCELESSGIAFSSELR